jgi:hypothetical protein
MFCGVVRLTMSRVAAFQPRPLDTVSVVDFLEDVIRTEIWCSLVATA